ncbi:MAG: cytochrome c-type biogenesis protein CcmH [Gemmatimonadales bacterium]|nr:cytochrome c-type biogenesis protein CcmH [Gemmatimonadota bacterium]MCL4213277.1 cytochrome c-type biogenesis protein CcmH [Gemmatimonadales bacterium]
MPVRRPTRRWLPLLAIAALAFVSAAVAAPARAQAVEPRYSQEIEREARRLFGEILSPYCPGLTLTSCPSEGAFILKDSIRAELAAGRTPDQVMQGLENRFGPAIHARPPATGFGLLAWIGPFVLIGVAGLGITWWVRSSARAAPTVAAPPDDGLDAAARARLDAALRVDP